MLRPAVLAGLFTLLIVPPARGWETVKLTPTLSLTGNYDDNIEFSPSDEIDDFYAQISPGLGLWLNLPVFPIQARYVYTRYQYREESRFNRDYHYLLIAVPDGIRITRDLYIEIWDKYEIVPIDVTLPEDDPYNLTQRNIFTIGPVWESQLTRKLKLRVGYEFSRVDYTSSGSIGDDYYGHRFFEGLYYEIDRRLTCFQRNSYQVKDYSRDPEYRQFLPEVGVKIGLGKRVSISASGGYSFEEIGGDRQDGYVYTISGNWAATEKLDLEAGFRRRRTIDIDGDLYIEQYGGLLLRYRPAERLTLEGYGRYYDDTFREVDSSRIELKAGLIYQLNRWSSLNCGYRRHQNVDMPSEESAVANRFYAGVNISFGTI